jgi:ATP-dependent protease Clp ATPase subunit
MNESTESALKLLLYCSFCGKSQTEVEVLVANKTPLDSQIYICNVCVDLCRDIVGEHRFRQPTE